MMIHIFPDEKFTIPNIEILGKSKYGEESIFFILRNTTPFLNEETLKINNTFFINSLIDSRLLRYLRKKNTIIFHSLLIRPRELFFLFFFRKNANSWNWVIWGGDMHQFPENMTAKRRMKFFFFKSIVSRFGFITTLSDKDYLVAKNKFEVKGKKLASTYALPGIESLDILSERSNDKKAIHFLIGNSADPSNQHHQVLKDLEFIKNENIKIIVPLSYSISDEEYVNSVIQLGIDIFQEKFFPITEFLTPKDYYEKLKDIDIAIFNNNRQQALGNIFVLMFFGSKLFLSEESGLVEKFQGMNAKVFNYKYFNDLTFDEICFYSQVDKNENKKISSSLLDQKKIMKQWEFVMEQMEA